MSSYDLTPYVLIGLVFIVWRLDRLGKQLQAVRDHLLIELGNEETRSETLRDREWEKKERKKEARQFWTFWGAGGLAVIIWYAISQH
jgi:hypothetical protein